MKNTQEFITNPNTATTGHLLKRKDYLGVDEEAGVHPNRTYYFKKNSDLDKIIETCTKKISVSL